MNTAQKMNEVTLKIERELREIYPNEKKIAKLEASEAKLWDKICKSPKLQEQYEVESGCDFDWEGV